MEEAQRLLTVSVGKLHRYRLQRGGLRLHRSLQLSLLVRAARHRYLTARSAAEQGPAAGTPLGMAPGDPQWGEPPTPPSPDPRIPRDREDPASPDRSGSQDQHRDHAEASPSRYRAQPSSPRPPQPPRDPPSAPCSEPGSPGSPPLARIGRKRRSSGSTGAGPVLVPSKRARLEAEEPPARCSGTPAAAFAFLVRAVGAC